MRGRKLVTVVGARPQFVKAAMLSRRLAAMPAPPFEEVLVNTGQHYDPALSDVFFRELNIPAPRHALAVGSGTAAHQTAAMLEQLGPLLQAEAPDALLVYGDTTSTLAAALAAAQLDIPVVHVEAGERVFRRRQTPEEFNRVLADHAAALCLAASRQGEAHLLREGMARQRVRFTGDLMYDLFRWGVGQRALRTVTPGTFGLTPGGYVLATIHRAENTDDPERLLGILRVLERAALPVLMPIHPRTRRRLEEAGYAPSDGLILTDPVGYFDMLGLLEGCRRCVSDSGGVIREAFFSRKPCIAPLARSWWSEITAAGWSLDAGPDLDMLAKAVDSFEPAGEYPEGLFGDGDAAGRIIGSVAELMDHLPATAPWAPQGCGRRVQDPPGSRVAFSYGAYRRMLGELEHAGYAFAPFGEAERLLKENKRFVLLRHDVDFDLDTACRMARLEAGMGVQSTYFIMARTPFYNILDAEAGRMVREILALGHHLGLHFDLAACAPGEDVAAACRRERELLSTWFGLPVEIVSFHRPNERVMSGDPALSAPIPHTYMPLYRDPICYLSDSQGLWRQGHPLESEAFRAGRPLQLLVHPIWYDETPQRRTELLDRLLDRQAEHLRRRLAENCIVYRMEEPPEGKES